MVVMTNVALGLNIGTRGLSSKAGLAFPKATQCLNLFSPSKFQWGQNWEGVRGNLPQGMEFVPTCRGGPNAGLCQSIEVEDAKYIFGPNEPDMPSQDFYGEGGWDSCATYWRNTVLPLKSKCKNGCKLIAPSVSNSQVPGQGLDYLHKFMNACGDGCQIETLNLHWHWFGALSGEEYFAHFKDHLEKAHSMFLGKKIWVNEYSAQQGTPKEIAKFVRLSSQYMDGTSWIERYAYFMAAPGDATTGALVSPDGLHLNEVGKQYNS